VTDYRLRISYLLRTKSNPRIFLNLRRANRRGYVKKITTLVGASLMLPATSFAADMPVKAPPKAAWVDSWAGPYIGAYFGAGAGNAAESFTGASASDTITTLNGVVVQTRARDQASTGNMAGDMTGSMVDLFAGYNWRIGNFVVGGQVEGTAFSDVALKTIGTQTATSVSLVNGGVTSSSSSSAPPKTASNCVPGLG
jgi:hypothetical protein